MGIAFEGNPSLEPESAWSVEAGVQHSIRSWLQGSVTGFSTRASGYWDYLEDPDGVYRPRKIARVAIAGVEGELKADLGKGFDAAVAYSCVDARYRRFEGNEAAEGKRVDEHVRHQARAQLVYAHEKGHVAGLYLQAYGERYTDPENSSIGRLPPFYVIGLRALGRISTRVAATLIVDNVLDTAYRTRPEFPEPGRAVVGGLRWSL